jgi:predicted dehydrogenase
MINIGIVGCGYWGPNLIRNFVSVDDCEVKYICDLDSNRLTYLSKLYPAVKTTKNFADLTNDTEIDAIAIATPVSKHFQQAEKSLESGKHIFIEKPMASSTKECMDLIELANYKKLTIMVGHTFIYTPVIRKIKEIIKNGDIGDVLYISSRRLNLGIFQKDINVAWDLAPHDISIILYLMDETPVAVNCQGKCHVNPGIEDVTSMTLDYKNGGFAIIHNSWLDPNKIREMVIVGSKKMIVYDDNQLLEKVKIYDKRVEIPPHYNTFAEFHYSYHYGDMYSPYIKQEEPLKIECSHFVKCIMTGTKPDTNGMEGLKVVKILEAASKSLKNRGSRIEIANVSDTSSVLASIN